MGSTINGPTYPNKKGSKMTSKKMSEMIQDTLELIDSILNRPATRSQVISVIKHIESLESKPESKAAVATETKIVKTKLKKQRSYISWRDHTFEGWFTNVLDGNTHLITYTEMTNLVPEWRKLNRSSMRNRFRVEGERRGYKSVTVKFDNEEKMILVQALM